MKTRGSWIRKRNRLLLVLTLLASQTGCASGSSVDVAVTQTPEAEVAEVIATPEPTPEPPKEYELERKELETLRAELEEDQAINPDVRCLLHFNSGLEHDPVLQSDSEDFYLYKNWKTKEYQSYGSIVLDSRNDLYGSDHNLILYGHFVYEVRSSDRTLAFTELAALKEEANYADNRYVSLILNDEVRYYEVAAIFEAPLETIDGMQYAMYGVEYNLLNYDREYMDLYRQNIANYQYYDTGVEISEEDNLLTLQTCIEYQHESRQIVLCKEVGRVPYETGEENEHE